MLARGVDLLDGLRVLDLADASGLLCGRILADLGADVIVFEPPGGSAARQVPPFKDGHSLTWLAGSINKRSITRPDVYERLLDVVDVVIETGHELNYERLAERNRGLILASLTAYGLHGPLSDCPASDLEITAASGSLWLAGEPARPPVRTSVPQTPSWTGMYAAAGVLMALVARDATGLGQHVDVSAQASMLTAISQAPIFWDLLGAEQSRSGAFLAGRSVTGAQFRNIWPCRDGYVTFALYGGQAGRDTARALIAWMDEVLPSGAPAALRAVDWAEFDVARAAQDVVSRLEAAIAPFFASLTKAEFAQAVAERGMLGYTVSTMADVVRDEQLASRTFWQRVEAPWGGEVCMPGGFAVFDGQRPRVRRAAPDIGEHDGEVAAELCLA